MFSKKPSPRKGIKQYKDGRRIFTKKKRTGVKLYDWPPIRYKKFLFDTGYSIMVRLEDKTDLWLNKSRIVIRRDLNTIHIEPDYFKTLFPESK